MDELRQGNDGNDEDDAVGVSEIHGEERIRVKQCKALEIASSTWLVAKFTNSSEEILSSELSLVDCSSI